MKVEAIIFDFGDTLATLKPSKEEIVREFLSSKNIKISIENIKCAYRIVDHCHRQSSLKVKTLQEKKRFLIKINSEILKVLGLVTKTDFWAPELYECFQVKKRWELFADVMALLEDLQRLGHEKAILANWDNKLKELVKRLGIEKFFSQILSSEELSMEKPDAKVFLHILKLLLVNPERAIYVGNEYEADVVGARNAGLIPVLIDRNNFWPYADCLRFESLTGLANYLKKY